MVAVFRITVVLCALAVAAIAMACDDGDTSLGEPCTNEATREAIRTANTIDEFRVADDEVACRLRRALLTLDDIPDGWTQMDRSSFERAVELSQECRVTFPGVITSLRASFSHPARDGVLIDHSIYALEPGTNERLFAALHRSCDLAARSSTPGESFFIGRYDAPQLGDGSIGVDFQFEPNGITTRAIYARYDDVLSVVTVTVDPDTDVERLATIVDRRIDLVGAVQSNEPTLFWAPCSITPTAVPGGATAGLLSQALLGLDDLNIGWVEDPRSPCDAPESTSCRSFPRGIASTEVDFSGWSHTSGTQ